MKNSSAEQHKIRFTVFLVPNLAEALQSMPRKKRNAFVNKNLSEALEKENLLSHFETMKNTKTEFAHGSAFAKNIRNEWTL